MKRTALLFACLVACAIVSLPSDLFARARMFHPGAGRFMQRDPLGTTNEPAMARNLSSSQFTQRDPTIQYADEMNLYQYCRSAPIQYGDPLGLKSVDIVSLVNWETNQKQRFYSSPTWRQSFWTKNRARVYVDDCCKINPLPDSDESQAGYRARTRMPGHAFSSKSDFTGDTKAKYWKAALECVCDGKKVDGLYVEVWHAFSTADAAQVSLQGGLEVEFGTEGAKSKGVLGGEIKFSKSTQLSKAKWLFLACPVKDDKGYGVRVRRIAKPNNRMTHDYHRIAKPGWRIGWTTQNIVP